MSKLQSRRDSVLGHFHSDIFIVSGSFPASLGLSKSSRLYLLVATFSLLINWVLVGEFNCAFLISWAGGGVDQIYSSLHRFWLIYSIIGPSESSEIYLLRSSFSLLIFFLLVEQCNWGGVDQIYQLLHKFWVSLSVLGFIWNLSNIPIRINF